MSKGVPQFTEFKKVQGPSTAEDWEQCIWYNQCMPGSDHWPVQYIQVALDENLKDAYVNYTYTRIVNFQHRFQRSPNTH